MSRTIKFRGWHTKMNKMFSAEQMANDQLTLLTTGEFINVHGDSTKLSTIYPNDKFIPLQYTELKDKNGVEIYEGDVVSYLSNISTNPILTTVIFENGRFIFEPINTGYAKFSYRASAEYEVIGNIHENPGLLEGE